MEPLAFRKCMESLVASGLAFDSLITDRHTSIAKFMRENFKNIKHYFDLWHLQKKVHKVLTKISKEKDGECLSDWIKPCENHLLWSATSTPSGDGELIWAKFVSFLSYIINKHSDLENDKFNECAHEELIGDRRWLEEDTPVYDKVCSVLTKPSLMKGIKKASPLAQTSCLEGFHSVVNQYAPKMTAYSYQGMYCRHIIAAVLFNYNLQRDVRHSEDGTEQVRIVYPKFKNGEATVRSVRVKPNHDYIEDIYTTFIETKQEKKLPAAVEELEAMTPAPMNTMLEKQSRNGALQLWKKRKSMVVQEVSGTEPVGEAVPVNRPVPAEKQPRRCRLCKNPMKNHKFVLDCPKNRRNTIT
ncbi:uncharacterized protein LOC116296014 [Actinia tenebrosa]|uniref:Uncharacterized protein LOC116296014 n=1 Tax=Actinia tenebrosa TaxID=6105 RepID=A0A6P8HWS8_ACTTE|nr:uncharacterized protein LOC116296014 [Actinia tenebrosa]